MKLFWMELKKIFSWRIVLLVVILNLLLFKMDVEFELEYFPNGRPNIDQFQLEKEMIAKYGEVIDEDEFADFLATYEKRVEEADQFLQNNEVAIAAGVETYEEYRNGDLDDPVMDDLHWHIIFELEEDLFWELQAREYYIVLYEDKERNFEEVLVTDSISNQKRKRLEEMLANEKFQYYDGQVLDNFQSYALDVTGIILLSIAIVLSPIYVRDKMSDVVPLQYTSKQGRRTFYTKWFAGLTAIAILLAVHLPIYGGLYLTNDTSHYFFMQLYSMAWEYVWYDITFGQYILLTVAAIIALAYLFGILTMVCSAFVFNYLTQIGTQILIFAAFSIIIMPIGLRGMIWTNYLPWVVPAIYITLFVIVYISSKLVKKRELVRDV